MKEKTILQMSLITAIIGLAALFFIPEMPVKPHSIIITWTNSTDSKGYECKSYWIKHDVPNNKTGCLSIKGKLQNNYITNARVLKVYRSNDYYPRCP